MSVKTLPMGRHTVTPYLIVHQGAALIDFLKELFGAELMYDVKYRSDGSLMHAELRIGDSTVMMGEPKDSTKLMPASIYIYVDDADVTYKRALEIGATSLMVPQGMPHGDRLGGVQDSFGNQWWVATHQDED